ncbi:hypothetical protein AALP_AA8G297400 [Arabis alpina]|uniref:Uncharacterized protein n=1 Tax=Arabis alpina TaxID=50452 RepID=A0A087GAB5_ARAAL|nr:hypothetical protein AALP_AA8G297400 [Arabis alpina]
MIKTFEYLSTSFTPERKVSLDVNHETPPEETLAVKDGFQKIPSGTDAANTQRADAVESVLGEFNEPKGPGDVSRSKGKGKVDLVDKKAEKKRIAAKAKSDLEAGRIPAFRIGETCEVLPSKAPVAQSLGVTPPASLPVSSDGAVIPPCPAVQIAVNVSRPPPPRASLTPSSRPASELLSNHASDVLANWTFSHVDTIIPFCNVAPRHKATLISLIGDVGVNLPNPDRLSISERLFCDWALDIINVINTGNRNVSAYEAEVQRRKDRIKTLASVPMWMRHGKRSAASALKEEKQRLEGEVKERDVHLEVASGEIAELRANLKKSRFTEDRLKKECDGARRRADEIASGSSSRSARHSSCLERIRLYLVALHAQE